MFHRVGIGGLLAGLLAACNPGGASSSLPEGHTTVAEDATGDITDTALAPDADGNPMIAYLDGTSLRFTRWDAAARAFTEPLAITDVGGDVGGIGQRAVGLAFDASIDRIALAFVHVQKNVNANDSTVVALTLSTDGGKTWSTPQTLTQGADTDVRDAADAAVAAGGGKVYVAYEQANYQCTIPNHGTCSGMWLLSGDGTSFTPEIAKGGDGVPVLADVAAPSLKLDAAGNPGLAFIVDPLSGYDKTVVFWRSGSPVTMVFDSMNVQNDDASASLAFDGTKPRIVAHLQQATAASYDMLYSDSIDGTTWSAPRELPRDGTVVTWTYQDISVDAHGALAIVADVNGSSTVRSCGDLAVLRSADGAQWSVCAADATQQFTGNFDGYVESYFTPDGSLAIVSVGNLLDNGPRGVHFWLVK